MQPLCHAFKVGAIIRQEITQISTTAISDATKLCKFALELKGIAADMNADTFITQKVFSNGLKLTQAMKLGGLVCR